MGWFNIQRISIGASQRSSSSHVTYPIVVPEMLIFDGCSVAKVSQNLKKFRQIVGTRFVLPHVSVQFDHPLRYLAISTEAPRR